MATALNNVDPETESYRLAIPTRPEASAPVANEKTSEREARMDPKFEPTNSSELTIVEEDWSHHLSSNFSYFDTVFLPLSSISDHESSGFISGESEHQFQLPKIIMEVRCMESLTPLDMLNLSDGTSDATGNRIWMGAVLFLECMVREIPFRYDAVNDHSTPRNHDTTRKQEALANLRRVLFNGNKVMELGSGTGAALIAIALAGTRKRRPPTTTKNTNESNTKGEEDKEDVLARNLVCPSFLTLTDNDTDILSLCKMNCERNFQKYDVSLDYRIGRLDWGDFSGQQKSSPVSQNPDHHKRNDLFVMDYAGLVGSQDTIIATDVIYDVSVIPILFSAAAGLLRDGGFFVLAHVPRVLFYETQDTLEEQIIAEASKCGFSPCFQEQETWQVLFDERTEFPGEIDATRSQQRLTIIRPSVLAELLSNDETTEKCQEAKVFRSMSPDYDYEELESCGASIMIFAKKPEDNA